MNDAAREDCALAGTLFALCGVGVGAYVLASGYLGVMGSAAVAFLALAVVLLMASIDVDEPPEGE